MSFPVLGPLPKSQVKLVPAAKLPVARNLTTKGEHPEATSAVKLMPPHWAFAPVGESVADNKRKDKADSRETKDKLRLKRCLSRDNSLFAV